MNDPKGRVFPSLLPFLDTDRQKKKELVMIQILNKV